MTSEDIKLKVADPVTFFTSWLQFTTWRSTYRWTLRAVDGSFEYSCKFFQKKFFCCCSVAFEHKAGRRPIPDQIEKRLNRVEGKRKQGGQEKAPPALQHQKPNLQPEPELPGLLPMPALVAEVVDVSLADAPTDAPVDAALLVEAATSKAG